MKKVENIKILSMKEEAELSPEELITYYNSLKEYLLKRKYTNLTPGALRIGPKLKKITNKLATKVTKMFSSKNVKIISDGQENIPDGPVIFAHTHQGILDGFVWIPEIDRHCFILHGSDVNKLLLMCQYNTGLILTKKSMSSRDTDEKKKMVKKYNLNAKMDMIELLINGHSISYFPEGTWNLSPNKLHLPINIGFLDIAKKAGVPVIPVVHEFTYKSDSDKEKIEKVAKNIYGATGVEYSEKTLQDIEKIEKMGYSHYPVCIAKTQYSFSDDPKNLECNEPYELHVNDIALKTGAEFIVVITGKIMTMPGLPRVPAAEKIDIDKNGNIIGIF